MLSAVIGLSRHFTEDSLRDYLLRRSERRDDGCLIIRGYGTRRGVHQKVAGRAWAHIAAYAAFVGNYDPDLEVDHLCDAPDCVEPTHLRQISHAENCRTRVQGPTYRNGYDREIDESIPPDVSRLQPGQPAPVAGTPGRRGGSGPQDVRPELTCSPLVSRGPVRDDPANGPQLTRAQRLSVKVKSPESVPLSRTADTRFPSSMSRSTCARDRPQPSAISRTGRTGIRAAKWTDTSITSPSR